MGYVLSRILNAKKIDSYRLEFLFVRPRASGNSYTANYQIDDQTNNTGMNATHPAHIQSDKDQGY